MTTLDFAPLFRSMIGFDRLVDSLEDTFSSEPVGYPPYNVELLEENRYRVTLAVAGFNEDELDIQTRENLLIVSGARRNSEAQGNYLYRGIANRGFTRNFQLADYVRVADARLENGLLHIDLVREVPEALKPQRITIHSADAQPAITRAA